jgi:hypothetical protein
LESLIPEALDNRRKTLVGVDEIGKFVEDDDSVLVAKVSEQRFPVLFDLCDTRKGIGGDIDKLVELYL